MSIFARGMAASYRRGAERIRLINEDRERVAFIRRLAGHAVMAGILLTDIEWNFVSRIGTEHNRPVPDIHSGDRNICDSLRRKYEPRLDAKNNYQ